MSDKERGRKMVEEIELQYFIEAYNIVATEPLSDQCSGHERPDFICSMFDGTPVGVELVRVMRDPSREWGHPLKGGSREKTPPLCKKYTFFA